MIKIVERLKDICLKKEKGYQHAAAGVKDAELHKLFKGLAVENKSFVAEWQDFLQGPSISEIQEHVVDDIFEDWMDFESDVVGEDKNSMIHFCELAEIHAINAYEEALENTLSDEVRRKITDHLMQIKNTLETLNSIKQSTVTGNG